jgi:hypothetical protein
MRDTQNTGECVLGGFEIDDQNRLWFCGRKTHRIYTKSGMKCSIPCEAIFNQHPYVKRSALIQLANGEPAIVVEIRL